METWLQLFELIKNVVSPKLITQFNFGFTLNTDMTQINMEEKAL